MPDTPDTAAAQPQEQAPVAPVGAQAPAAPADTPAPPAQRRRTTRKSARRTRKPHAGAGLAPAVQERSTLTEQVRKLREQLSEASSRLKAADKRVAEEQRIAIAERLRVLLTPEFEARGYDADGIAKLIEAARASGADLETVLTRVRAPEPHPAVSVDARKDIAA